MAQKKKEGYVELYGLLGNAEDYHVYHMNRKDNLIAWAIGFAIGTVVIYAFFRNLIFTIVGAVVCALLAPPYYNDFKKNERLKLLRSQFKDLLESLSASYSAGKNTSGAFSDALGDMISIYGEDADIVKELQIICSGLANNINIEVLLVDFAKRSDLDDIMSFANVFEVCNRQGGDLKKVVSDSREIINDKIEVEMEIETMIAGSKNELNIMMVMPVVVVLSLSSMGTMTIISNSPVNLVVKLICIAIFGVAYMLGRKIVDIKI